MKIQNTTIIGLLFLLLSGCSANNNLASLMSDGIDFLVSGKEDRAEVPVIYPVELSASEQNSKPRAYGANRESVSDEYGQYHFNKPAFQE